MKNLITKVFGMEMYANAQNIHGRKSSGVEDEYGYKHWRAQPDGFLEGILGGNVN